MTSIPRGRPALWRHAATIISTRRSAAALASHPPMATKRLLNEQGAGEGPPSPALLVVGPTFLQAVTAAAAPKARVEGVLPFPRTALKFQSATLHLAVLPESSHTHVRSSIQAHSRLVQFLPLVLGVMDSGANLKKRRVHFQGSCQTAQFLNLGIFQLPGPQIPFQCSSKRWRRLKCFITDRALI